MQIQTSTMPVGVAICYVNYAIALKDYGIHVLLRFQVYALLMVENRCVLQPRHANGTKRPGIQHHDQTRTEPVANTSVDATKNSSRIW